MVIVESILRKSLVSLLTAAAAAIAAGPGAAADSRIEVSVTRDDDNNTSSIAVSVRGNKATGVAVFDDIGLFDG